MPDVLAVTSESHPIEIDTLEGALGDAYAVREFELPAGSVRVRADEELSAALSGVEAALIRTGEVTAAALEGADALAAIAVHGSGYDHVDLDAATEREAMTDAGVEFVGRDAVFERADLVTLHVPLTGRTEGMVGATELAALDGGYLINTARGGVVVDDALVEALDAGTLERTALDVLRTEPLADDDPLLPPRSYVTATKTVGTCVRTGRFGASNGTRRGSAGRFREAEIPVPDRVRHRHPPNRTAGERAGGEVLGAPLEGLTAKHVRERQRAERVDAVGEGSRTAGPRQRHRRVLEDGDVGDGVAARGRSDEFAPGRFGEAEGGLEARGGGVRVGDADDDRVDADDRRGRHLAGRARAALPGRPVAYEKRQRRAGVAVAQKREVPLDDGAVVGDAAVCGRAVGVDAAVLERRRRRVDVLNLDGPRARPAIASDRLVPPRRVGPGFDRRDELDVAAVAEAEKRHVRDAVRVRAAVGGSEPGRFERVDERL